MRNQRHFEQLIPLAKATGAWVESELFGHENVAERGVIISTRGVFDIDRALPEAALRAADAPNVPEPAHETRILSAMELEAFERANIVRALEAANWKVSGPSGAAALLQINVSTLNSRLRALEISRPRGA